MSAMKAIIGGNNEPKDQLPKPSFVRVKGRLGWTIWRQDYTVRVKIRSDVQLMGLLTCEVNNQYPSRSRGYRAPNDFVLDVMTLFIMTEKPCPESGAIGWVLC